MNMRSHYVWLLPLLGLCVLALVIMFVLDSNMARQSSKQELSTSSQAEAQNLVESATGIAEISDEPQTSAVEVPAETTDAEDNPKPSSIDLNFDFGQSLTTILNSSLALLDSINNVESANAAVQDLDNYSSSLSGLAALTQLLAQEQKQELSRFAKEASSSLNSAFERVNKLPGIDNLLQTRQSDFMQALSTLQ